MSKSTMIFLTVVSVPVLLGIWLTSTIVLEWGAILPSPTRSKLEEDYQKNMRDVEKAFFQTDSEEEKNKLKEEQKRLRDAWWKSHKSN